MLYYKKNIYSYGVTPNKRNKHRVKTMKHSEQNIKVEITTTFAKFGSQTFLSHKNLEQTPKMR